MVNVRTSGKGVALRSVALAVLTTGLAGGSLPAAAADGPGTETVVSKEYDPDARRFRIALYGWAPSIAGNLTARGQTVDVNESFIQLLQKSDSLIGYMGYFEANKGRVGFFADVVWARLGFSSSNASFRNPIAGLQISTSSNTAVTYSLTIVEAAGSYEFARWQGSPGTFTALDGYLGFRYWNNSVDLNFDITGTVDFSRLSAALGRDIGFTRSLGITRSANLDWVDPVVGLRLRHQFTPSQEVTEGVN
jgi:hypothetical protein